MTADRTYMVALFDVTDLNEDERGGLQLEVAVQAEESDAHPDVGYPAVVEVYGGFAATLTQLAVAVQDEVAVYANRGARVARVTTLELADGSRRWAAVVNFYDAQGDEFGIRVAMPAPANAPRWARDNYPTMVIEACESL